ncbi:chemotaxis response regulator protein-glutamate methylesterase [Acidobacteria bacterium AB60]|nr:chemotaxis response regulator protein-glutamate methylesterase [Acidobacteria bacterium AB60]
MSNKIRVLAVDDSAVMRRLLLEAIASDPALELAGTAGNGLSALAMIERLQPDIVTLDIEMPHMNGLETLKEIRSKHAKLPVIMCSSLTSKGATATIECLSLGASDYVTKPERVSNLDMGIQMLKDTLIAKVLALCPKGSGTARSSKPVGGGWNYAHPSGGAIDVVAIGCSTGGPKALAEVLPSLPGDFPVPIVIVQHMPAEFTRALAERLSGICALPVREAYEGAELLPGAVWIARGDYHMTVVRQGTRCYLATPQTEPENFCRPSVDVLFRSLADAFGGRVLALVLTGMGQDGLRGCTRLAELGAQVVVQDEGSSVVWGMPGFVARSGLAQAVLPLNQIASEVAFRVNASRSAAA